MTCFFGPRAIGLNSIVFRYASSLSKPTLFILPLWIPEKPFSPDANTLPIPINSFHSGNTPHPRLLSIFRDLPAKSFFSKQNLKNITFRFIPSLQALYQTVFQEQNGSNPPAHIFILNFSDFFINRVYLLYEGYVEATQKAIDTSISPEHRLTVNQDQNPLQKSETQNQSNKEEQNQDFIFSTKIFSKMTHFLANARNLNGKTLFVVDEYHSDIVPYLSKHIRYTQDCINKLKVLYSRFLNLAPVTICPSSNEIDNGYYTIDAIQWHWNINTPNKLHISSEIIDIATENKNDQQSKSPNSAKNIQSTKGIKKLHGRVRELGAFD